MNSILHSLHRKLIVSCQAAPNDPMEDSETLRRVARSAVMGGASGLRLNSPEDVRAVRLDTTLPIIAIQKSYEGGQLRITPDFASARALAEAGADIIALDCTDRPHLYGEPWREIVRRIHDELGLLVMADIATLRDGILAAEGGADIVAPTLHGYTEETKATFGFHPELVTALARETGKPVIAEGNVSTPALARIALEAGAWSVVVGSAITRPGSITATFVEAIRPLSEPTSKAARYVIGIDIGGTAIKSAVIGEDGSVHLPQQVPTLASKGRETIAVGLSTALTQTLKAAAEAKLEIAGIGVASAGAIDSANGIVFAATENLPGWAGFHLRQYLQGFTELPIFVENDAQAAALAELRFGVAQGLSNFVALTIGTGIGGGIVIDGRLIRGTHGFAGTLGHHVIRFDGRPCNCGRRGCLEAYVSTAALIEEYRQLEPSMSTNQPAAIEARQIAERAIAGDANAHRAYSQLADHLAEGIANICNLLDPEAIVLSGGLIEGQPDFLVEVQQRSESLLHFGAKRPPRLIPAAAGLYAGVQGAAATAFDQLPTPKK
jgi:glucokinase-like ROK family protein